MELIDFCLANETRFDLTKLFKLANHPGKVFATDGRWLAWMKEEDNKWQIFSDRPPEIPVGWIIDFEPTESIPDFEVKKEKCTFCENGTTKDETCTECDGYGTTECFECEQDRDCPECDGIGKISSEGDKCEECDGYGWNDETPPVMIHDKKFGPKYLSKLKEADAKVMILDHVKEQPLLLGFKFGNITGFLLGISQE